ncbi:taurine catabolism dioxygenase family protein [Sporothrix brasiliensis 5110]|uniref:Taurine catabolism dioxygenase family protein n=1 Tax=Sporothrix brasiliensis 5110 TaxID=1398154 RepID=A0A0C2J762_9PEZI|nr:taurine catabolism dioxygenase family protein [Sporothrix brasiliensis 5110]KIH94835.1 taurine catabolism dioxygenase family protein [Sporothrix brasiliensis 5110]
MAIELSISHAVNAAGWLLAATVLWFGYRAYVVRSHFQRLQRQGVPMLPHHPILGHLGVVGKLMKDMPGDVHGDYLMLLIQDNWRTLFDEKYTACPPAVYLDMWPASMPFMLSLHPDMSAQFTQDVNMEKAEAQGHFLRPLTSNLDVASSHGAAWKKLRRRMNLGFSAQAIRARLPALMEEVEVFRDILVSRAGKNGAWGTVFTLEELATMLTLDFIGRFTFDVRLHEQTSPLTPMTAAMLDTLPRLRVFTHIGNVWSLFNPWVTYKLWSNVRCMDAYLAPRLEERRAALTAGEPPAGGTTLVDTLFTTIAAESPADANTTATLDYVVAETKHTLFAGHETTAFTLAWLFRTLATEPTIVANMMAEHDAVLGPDPDAAADRLRDAPHLIGQLPYTTAVIKESMRIHTNVGTLRAAPPGAALYGPAGSGYDGVAFPTDMCVLWDANFAIHRNPAYWPRPLEFVPERWLTTDKDDPLHPRRNAYRPFEQGPRNCVGQHMAMTEMTMVLALVVRTLEVEEAWAEWDAKRGATHKKKATVWGDRLYQVSKHGPPHVKDGMPVHVRLRQR